MKTKIAMALIINACVAMPAIAADIYRWTDPETGKIVTTTSLPPYPVKEKRSAGGLPGGELVNVILDTEAPQIKAIIEKRKLQEADEKRIAEEQAKQKAAMVAEKERLAAEHAKSAAERAKEEKKQKIANELILKQQIVRVKSIKEKDVEFMVGIIDEFIQYDKFASSTARIALAVPINNLLSVKMKLSSYRVASCYDKSKHFLLQWMDLTIRSYYAFSAKEEFKSTEYKTEADYNLELFFSSVPDSCG